VSKVLNLLINKANLHQSVLSEMIDHKDRLVVLIVMIVALAMMIVFSVLRVHLVSSFHRKIHQMSRVLKLLAQKVNSHQNVLSDVIDRKDQNKAVMIAVVVTVIVVIATVAMVKLSLKRIVHRHLVLADLVQNRKIYLK
jgi:hypothetical protein